MSPGCPMPSWNASSSYGTLCISPNTSGSVKLTKAVLLMFSVNHILLVYRSDTRGKGCLGVLPRLRPLLLGVQMLPSHPGTLWKAPWPPSVMAACVCCHFPFLLSSIWTVINQTKFWEIKQFYKLSICTNGQNPKQHILYRLAYSTQRVNSMGVL